MAYTEFCCRSGGSNLNAGTRLGDSTEPGTSASLTYASGTWVSSTGVFSIAIGNPVTDGVAVGDFASVYANGSTVTGFVGRVTARDTTTITVSLTAKSGSAPADGTSNRTLKIGGAWLGPNGTEDFPLGFVTSSLTNSSGDSPCINLKNDADYSITDNLAHANTYTTIYGYQTTYRDTGRATLTSSSTGTTGLSISAANIVVANLIVKSTAASGSTTGINVSAKSVLYNISVQNFRGSGFTSNATYCLFVECEAYNCNIGNSASHAGFISASACLYMVRCSSVKNTGSNNSGYRLSSGAIMIDCIAANNQIGLINSGGSSTGNCFNCDFYNNVSHGISSSTTVIYCENCNFFKNGGYGIINNNSGSTLSGFIINCAFGSGTMANTSGQTSACTFVLLLNNITYATDLHPWVDPVNGNFSISRVDSYNTGRGTFGQGVTAYCGTIKCNDIGAGKHIDKFFSYGMHTGGQM